MTPIRANVVGPPSVVTRIRLSIADALNDRAGVNVAVIDVPAFLAVLWRSAAGEGGHVPLKRESLLPASPQDSSSARRKTHQRRSWRHGGAIIVFKYHHDKPITNREGGIAKLGINVRGEGG
jgi:hypothetical protein